VFIKYVNDRFSITSQVAPERYFTNLIYPQEALPSFAVAKVMLFILQFQI
ncbi:hypothetical protein HMPREF9134_00732, partial [Porphyromonas catoniae F0037]